MENQERNDQTVSIETISQMMFEKELLVYRLRLRVQRLERENGEYSRKINAAKVADRAPAPAPAPTPN